MSFQKGDVVLAPFPFTDLSQAKLRPAVVLWASATGKSAEPPLLVWCDPQRTAISSVTMSRSF